MSDDDPFDRLDADEDREGDPFDRLDPPGDDDSDAPAGGDTADDAFDGDPWGPPGEDRRDVAPGEEDSPPVEPPASADIGSESSDATTPPSTGSDDDPFPGVSTPDGSPFDAGGPSVFERVDVGATDPDQVWKSITSEDEDGEPSPLPEEGRYSEVSKHAYCEGCEYFSPPPAVTCTHESAEIIEFLDMETVRLLDCPVVAEREALKRGD